MKEDLDSMLNIEPAGFQKGYAINKELTLSIVTKQGVTKYGTRSSDWLSRLC